MARADRLSNTSQPNAPTATAGNWAAQAAPSEFSDLEPIICDLTDMADVCAVVASHHQKQVVSVAETSMTAKQAIEALSHTDKLVNFCIYQLADMGVTLRREYYALLEGGAE
jgi:hypothetical protein